MNPRVQAALEAAGESALTAFGIQAQMVKTCEELGELTTQLCKRLNANPQATDETIVDEVADVLIMATQMRLHFGDEKVDERILYKLDRTIAFIRSRAAAKTPEKEQAPQ